MNELLALNRDGATVMCVTHDLKVAAKCSRVLYLVDGCELIKVSNTGCTLETKELPQIFESFYRGNNADNVQGVLQITLEATDMGQPLYERYGFVKMEDEMELVQCVNK